MNTADPRESLAAAERATALHGKRFAAHADSLPDGASVKSGKRTYTKQTIEGAVFWVSDKGKGCSSAQVLTETGHKAWMALLPEWYGATFKTRSKV